MLSLLSDFLALDETTHDYKAEKDMVAVTAQPVLGMP
jgi:hypothetical protein